jgi:hypothetical protein
MKNTKRTAIAVSAALVLPASAAAHSALASSTTSAAPPPGSVTMEVVTVDGSGCPPGTATVTPSHDGAALTVTYRRYAAWAGGTAPPTAFRQNCQLNVRVTGPEGYTYAVTGTESRGYAHLQRGTSALQRTNYYFQGDSRSQSVSHTLQGPYDDDWHFTDTTDPSTRVYKPCDADRNLNINTELRVSPDDGSETSFIAMESTYADAVYHLTWKHCT